MIDIGEVLLRRIALWSTAQKETRPQWTPWEGPSDRQTQRVEELPDRGFAEQRDREVEGKSDGNVEIELRVPPSSEASPEVVAARAEFDQLILELCSTDVPGRNQENWLTRFIHARMMKRAIRVLAEYEELRLTLSIFANPEYWQAARDCARWLACTQGE